MKILHACLVASTLFGGATASANELLTDPGFDQGDTFWGKFGNADFNMFFGSNPHASFFADGAGNFGGVFQTGIAGSEGTVYTFSLTNVRIESNFNADFRFGLEFYAADDATKLGESFFNIDTSNPTDGLVTGDGLSFTHDATAVAGTVFVRPVILFDNAAPLGSGQGNAFVFTASLVPAPGAAGLLLAGTAFAARRRRG